MKLLFLFVIMIACISASAQTSSICIQVDCKDTVKYPQDTVTLNGIITSPDGIKPPKWKVTWGTATIDNPNLQATVARGLSKGGTLFIFSLTDTSLKGAIGVAYDSVIYLSNQPPTAVTGNYTLSTSAILSGSNSTDPEGLPLRFSWVQSSGPNTAVITSSTMSNPIVSGLVSGTYIFTLTVTDSGNKTSTATQTVTVP